MWNTSRLNAEPHIDTWSWNQIPGKRHVEPERKDRRMRHGYRRFRSCMEYMGRAAMAFVATVLVLQLWSVL